RPGRAAVVAQGGQQRVERLGAGARQVGGDPAAATVGLADQVVPQGTEAVDVGGEDRAAAVAAADGNGGRGRVANTGVFNEDASHRAVAGDVDMTGCPRATAAAERDRGKIGVVVTAAARDFCCGSHEAARDVRT